jgi:S1-C subfamily serine protease
LHSSLRIAKHGKTIKPLIKSPFLRRREVSAYDEKKVLDIIEKASKSVVNISTIKLVHNMFYQAVPVAGMGSGAIIDTKGLILTNNHVVGGAEKIHVILWNNEALEGKIVGSCAVHDIAVVKVNGKNLQAAELGNSDKLRVGQRVYAIGNPFGLAGGPTVTSGVISAVNRTIESERGLIENLVQTDAAINPGNSGGPLVDLEGKVVAISTAIIPFAQGIGFTVPINAAKACTNGMMAESPAEDAGMADGDIILELDNVETRRIEELVKGIHKRKSGDKVKIFALRNGREHFFELKLSGAH